LLLNHLPVDRDCKLIFDASNAILDSEEEGDNAVEKDDDLIDIPNFDVGI